jgi:transcriptional regulator with XRE-family HTH domain
MSAIHDNKNRLGRELKRLRKRKGLVLKQVVDYLIQRYGKGAPYSTESALSRVECGGRRGVARETLLQLLGAYEVTDRAEINRVLDLGGYSPVAEEEIAKYFARQKPSFGRTVGQKDASGIKNETNNAEHSAASRVQEPAIVEPNPLLGRQLAGYAVIAFLQPDHGVVFSGLQEIMAHEKHPLIIAPERKRSLELLFEYFFPLTVRDLGDPAARVALVTGIDDRYDPASPRKFSESGSWVAAQYLNVFRGVLRDHKIERVADLSGLRDDDALVLLGSQEVNPKAREYLGDPAKHTPIHRVTVRRRRGPGYKAELPWAMFTPEQAREVRIRQTREGGAAVVRHTREHMISCLDDSILRSEAGSSDGHDVWLTDYLLVTALPTDASERRRVIAFAGLHRSGTLAAGRLLSEYPSHILNQIHESLGGHRYFQALLKLDVDNTKAQDGRAQPGAFTDMKVKPIRIETIGAERSR